MRRSGIAALLALAVGAGPAWSQNAFVSLSRTHFSVADAHGHLVTTLGPDDVTIYDNDVPQHLAEFGSHPDAPVDMALLIDRSASIGSRLPELVSAARRVLVQGIAERDRALVVAFDSKVYLLQDWTGDSSRVADAIAPLTAAGGTALFDALFKSCRDRFTGTDARHNVVVLLTDGEDTTSAATLDQALEMLTLSRVTVHAIAVKEEAAFHTGELPNQRVLDTLTSLTGGRQLDSGDHTAATLAAFFTRIQEEARQTYSATYYHAQPPDGTFHHIRIVPRDSTLVVHAPTGYFARVLPST